MVRFAQKLILMFLLLNILVQGHSAAQDKPAMLFFYSQECDECKNVKNEFLPGFLEKYGEYFHFVELEVSNLANLDSLYALEYRVGVPEEDKDYPAIYFMGTMIEGAIPVSLKLESLVKNYLAHPDSMRAIDREVMSRNYEAVQPEVGETNVPVSIVYFYKHGCKECSRAEEIIEWLKGSYPFLKVDVRDISERQDKILATALGLRSGIPKDKLMSTPVFFIGSDYVLSEDISRKHLAELVEKYARTGADAFWMDIGDEELKRAEGEIYDLFRTFTFFAVALAGLGDGINPCAFASILFFVSYLGMIGRKRNEILFVGLSFAFAVFLTYFLIGLGFFNIVKRISYLELVSNIIFLGTGVLCFIFGFVSINDYFKARAGKTSEMTLQLPMVIKRRIHSTIREKTRMQSFVMGALIAGFLVSILELACTGQVYLPTITLIVQEKGGSLAMFYLILYNMFFIIPLLLVFGFVYFGTSSHGIAKVMESRVGMVKLVLAVIFFSVGGLLFWAVL